MSAYKTMNKVVETVLNLMIVVTFVVLIGACVLQVFTRFVLNNSLSWTEELARYAFIWSNFLGAAICTKKASHATVTVITDSIPPRVKMMLNVVVYLLVVAISAVLVGYGFKVAFAVRTQLSPALRVSMGYVYGAAPVSGLFILYYAAVHFVSTLRELGGKEKLL